MAGMASFAPENGNFLFKVEKKIREISGDKIGPAMFILMNPGALVTATPLPLNKPPHGIATRCQCPTGWTNAGLGRGLGRSNMVVKSRGSSSRSSTQTRRRSARAWVSGR